MIGAIVMAGGIGKRMRSKLAKVLHPVAGRPMLLYAVELAARIADAGVTVVVGHQAAQVKALLDGHAAATGGHGGVDRARGLTAHVGRDAPRGLAIQLAEQTEQLGTGHAVLQAREVIRRVRGGPADVYVILNGDTPLLADATVRAVLAAHRRHKAGVTLLTTTLKHPAGYGRIVRADDGRVLRIVEDRDASEAERRIHEINVGTYVIDGPFLFDALDKLEPNNAQREYYLTDLVKVAAERGVPVAAHTSPDPEECLGINSRQQLAEAERMIRARLCRQWMDAGVTLRDPQTTVIDADVEIGQDTVIHPFVTLEGRTRIGSDCIIRSHTRVTNSVLGHRVVVQDGCVIQESVLEDETAAGPYAHLRPGTVLRRAAKVGNFVELKKTELGERSKANHLSYLGDARIGCGVNVGAGTITCNYDGERKFETVIEDDVFIGSDTQLVAPVTVGRGSIVAAGTTVTQDVPPDSLAISRMTQVNKPGWPSKRRNLPPPQAAAGSGHEARGPRQDRLDAPPPPRASRPARRAPARGARGKKRK